MTTMHDTASGLVVVPARLSPYGYGALPGGTHQTILRRIPDGSDVLDVGCNRGYLGSVLHRRGCRVWGVDNDEEALRRLEPGSHVATSALELDTVAALPWPDQEFDVVIAADILEHLRDPARMLSMLVEKMRPGGRIFVSLPNVAHASIRADLARGRFAYRDSGILDRTHLHFYTFDTAREFVESAGLRITATLSGSNRFGLLLNNRPRLGRMLRGLLAFNIIIEAVPAGSP
jgi:methionine biosynthesis protein MetW